MMVEKESPAPDPSEADDPTPEMFSDPLQKGGPTPESPGDESE